MAVRIILCKYQIYFVIFLIICALVFIVLGHKYRDQIQTKLKRPLITAPKSDIDYWSCSHFLLFLCFGFIIPNYHFNFFMLGVFWEALEDFLCKDEDTQLANCKNPYDKNGKRKFWCCGIQTDYWYMNWTDIFSNLLGYVVGSSLRTTFLPKYCKHQIHTKGR